jgi:hypothetical protein
MVFNMVVPNWKKLNIWNESYMVNFKPISNTLEMDLQKALICQFWSTLICFHPPKNYFLWCAEGKLINGGPRHLCES